MGEGCGEDEQIGLTTCLMRIASEETTAHIGEGGTAGPNKGRLVAVVAKSQPTDATDREPLSGLVERVTFHSSETGFCVLRVKVRGHRDLVTVVGTAPTITAGEFIDSIGWWVTDR